VKYSVARITRRRAGCAGPFAAELIALHLPPEL
jgi:hypothetical protein